MTFEQLEEKCLLLDILIDCEEYGDFATTLDEVEDIGIKCIKECIKDPTEKKINKRIEYIQNKKIKKEENVFNSYFEIILNSKSIRRILHQNKRNIQRKKVNILFQKLAEALIKTIPARPIEPEQIGDQKERIKLKNINKLRIIFLNEISAVSKDHLAIGYAETALSELKGLNKDWLPRNNEDKSICHPYELYALYNKGLTQVHDPKPRTAEQAIDTFFQILNTFEKNEENTDLRETFKHEYKKVRDNEQLFDIFFWLIYVPTNHLLAEAYDDLNRSYDLEKAISNVFKKIEGEKVSLDNYNEKIKEYHKARFAIQLLLSKIYSGNFDKNFKSHQLNENWLQAFEKSFLDYKQYIALNTLKEYSKTKRELDAAEALFWLEYTKVSKTKVKESVKKSFDICAKHLKIYDAPDWSDFAITFLCCIIFILEGSRENWKSFCEDEDWLKKFDLHYEKIFEILTKKEWVPRKKELVEKFLSCQDELLRKCEQDKQLSGYAKYADYQIQLVNIILDDDENKHFQKKWPEWQREKLQKSLRNSLDVIGNCNLLDSFKRKVADINSFPKKNDFGILAKFIQNNMNSDLYTRKLRLNAEKFYDHLIYQSCRPSLEDHYALTVLRRWQSFTPALSSGSEVGQKGGGYFVYKTNKKGEVEEGLIIDPGFNFLENFFEEGFSIRDINAILMTHSHPDHSSDFMSIITLVHEMNQCGKRVFMDGKWEKRKLVLFMTGGCHQNFAEQLNGSKEAFCDIIRAEQGIEYGGNNTFLNHFKLKVTKANHDDLTDYDSVGYVILDKMNNPLIGFTGDTQWFLGIEENYKKCPVLCMNIGGVVDIFKDGNIMLSDLTQDNDKDHRNIKNMLLRENHLYLPGFYLMAKKLSISKQKLLIISELCEEMKGGLRTDLASKMSTELRIPALPEDIGLTVVLDKRKKGHVFCKVCQSAHSPKKIVPVETDKDNAIVYLCDKHYDELKEGYYLPKINELELDENELRKPLIKKGRTGFSKRFRAI